MCAPTPPKRSIINLRLNLPTTDFPMRAGLPNASLNGLARGGSKIGVYDRLREEKGPHAVYACMDGPPLPPNGHLHIGARAEPRRSRI